MSVEYPQFQAICRTLFPSAGTHEIASMFSQCYEEGKNRQGVSAEVFMRVADLSGMIPSQLNLLNPLIHTSTAHLYRTSLPTLHPNCTHPSHNLPLPLSGMFSRSLRLSTLPVLEQHSPTPFNKVTSSFPPRPILITYHITNHVTTYPI